MHGQKNIKEFTVISLTDKPNDSTHRQKFPYLFCFGKSVVSNFYK